MEGWVLWVLVGVALAVGELLTGGFFLAPFALGALLAAVVAGVGAGAVLSVIVFLAVSIAALGLNRPIARAHRRMPPRIRTGTAALVGKPATVLERIANHEGAGCVKIEGEVWTARAYDEDRIIETGKRVEVVEIRGATALVSE